MSEDDDKVVYTAGYDRLTKDAMIAVITSSLAQWIHTQYDKGAQNSVVVSVLMEVTASEFQKGVGHIAHPMTAFLATCELSWRFNQLTDKANADAYARVQAEVMNKYGLVYVNPEQES